MSKHRCRRCRHRQKLPPVAKRKCKNCGARDDGNLWVLDQHRVRIERNSKVTKLCRCPWYHFPHRHGSGFCIHNSRVTADRVAEREGFAIAVPQPPTHQESQPCPF